MCACGRACAVVMYGYSVYLRNWKLNGLTTTQYTKYGTDIGIGCIHDDKAYQTELYE